MKKATERTAVGQIAAEYCQKYPEVPTSTIARWIYVENPDVYTSFERARNAVRYYRNALGVKNKKSNKENFETPIYYPESDNVEYIRHKISDQYKRGAILSDIHFPYHDRGALKVCFDYLITFKPEFIIFNGDIIDFHGVSSFERDPRKKNIAQEIEMTKDFLYSVKDAFPKAKIIFKAGNHEERYDRYILLRAPELFHLENVRLKNVLDLEKMGIQYIDRKEIITYRELNIIHGHEYRFSISNPVNPARGIFLRTHKSTIAGHFHQASEHTEPTIDNDIITCWSMGCLCHLNPEYMPLNKWSHGFATIEPEGKLWRVENRKIFNGKLL